MENLDEAEKKICAKSVYSYIKNNNANELPFCDVKRMEYCCSLMRSQILKKLKKELLMTGNSLGNYGRLIKMKLF